MIGTPARRSWNVVVGFFLGGIFAQFIGIASIALYQTATGTGFSWINLYSLTLGQRLFYMAIPATLGLVLLRSKPYVAVGTFLYSAFIWFVTAPYR
ncbi:MAG: hypothetical protein JO119_13490 [Acidobacteria bacterium]|nr:hypothetical protein [Acidobacteriota bacterium]